MLPVRASWGATANFNWSTGELTVNLSSNGDTCQIGYGPAVGNAYYLAIWGTADGYNWGANQSITTKHVKKIVVNGGLGIDTINLSDISTDNTYWDNALEGNITLYGNGSGDTITGSARQDIIYGGSGNDIIDGKVGDDVHADYEAGDSQTNCSAVVINHDTQTERLTITPAPSSLGYVDFTVEDDGTYVHVKMAGVVLQSVTVTLVRNAIIVGTNSPDEIASNVYGSIFGLGGSDVISAEGGDIHGGDDDDSLTVLAGTNHYYGGEGDDDYSVSGGTIELHDDIWVDCYHVGEEMGTDSNRPFKTIQQAVDLVGAGGNVWINGTNGRTYYERVLVRQKFGTSADRITISGYGFSKPVIDGRASDPNGEPNLPIGYGSPYNALVWIDNCKHVTVENIKVQYSRRTGISVTRHDVPPNNPDVAVEDVIVKNCDVEETAEYGIAVGGGISGAVGGGISGIVTNICIENNTVDEVCTAIQDIIHPPGTILDSEGNPVTEENPLEENETGTEVEATIGEAIRITHATDIDVLQNVVENYHKEGINLVDNVSDVNIYGNLVGPHAPNANGWYPCDASCGICVDGWEDTPATVFDIDIFGNVVFGCGAGLNVRGERGGGVDDVMFYNNIVSTIGQGFSFWGAAGSYSDGPRTNVKVYNNTFVGLENTVDATGNQLVVRVHPTDLSLIEGFEFKNNIVAREYEVTNLQLFGFSNAVSSAASNPPQYVISHNLYWDAGQNPRADGVHGEFNQVNENPVFNSAGVTVGGQLWATPYAIDNNTSAAINEGTILPSVTTDIQGHDRPYGGTHDIGAFEDH